MGGAESYHLEYDEVKYNITMKSLWKPLILFYDWVDFFQIIHIFTVGTL